MNFLNHEASFRGGELVKKLAETKFFVCGAGSLGSIFIDSIVRMGAQSISVIDFDRVEEGNAGTQIYGKSDIGKLKVDALAMKIYRELGVRIEGIGSDITKINMNKYDANIYVDLFDNNKARAFITEYCQKNKKICIHAGTNGAFAEVKWNESYKVPKNVGGIDNCDYPLSRNLSMLTITTLIEVIFGFLVSENRRNANIFLPKMEINFYE